MPAALHEAHHGVGTRYPLQADAWSTEWCHSRWVADWVDADRIATRVQEWNGGAEFERAPCTWHVYAAGTRYRERYHHPQRIREDLWFFFSWQLPIPPMSERPFSVLSDPEGRLAGYIRTVHAQQELPQPGSELVRQGAFATAIGEMLLASRHAGDGSPSDPWVIKSVQSRGVGNLSARIDALVMRRLADPPSLAELAVNLSMSSSSLSHIFKAETGMTPMQRVRWLRIVEARRMLGAGASVKETARRLGFPSPAYFASAFRRATGLAPSEFQAAQKRRG